MAHRARGAIVAGVAMALAAATLVPAAGASASTVYEDMRASWMQRLTGGDGFDPDAAPFAAQVTSVTDTAQGHWDGLDITPTAELWADLGPSVEDLLEAYRRLNAMAVAYATHGSALEGDPDLRDDIIASLDWVDANRYSDTVTPTGNWWHREIGIPLELNELTTLLYADLTATQRTNYMDAVHRFTPSVTQTGANRVWKAMVVAGRGLNIEDPTSLAAAQTGLAPALAVSTAGDGFYADGSFVQHQYYAYTGGYGLSYLVSLVDLLALLDGTTWEPTASIDRVYDWVERSFAPFFYRGALMDTVRGREMSRPFNGDHEAGATLIRAVLDLSLIAPAPEQAWLRPMAKQWIDSASVRDFFSSGPISSLIAGHALMADASVAPRAELSGAFLYPEMARAVHHRAGYSLAIGMSSPKIAGFESINGENRRGYYTGEGATFLYNGDGSQFAGNFWATMNEYRVPGTTVDTVARGAGVGAGYRNPETFVGGAVARSGSYAVVGMGLDAHNSALAAQKSWFLFGDEVVALGSGVTMPAQTGAGWDGQPRRAETIVEHRRLAEPGQELTVDGTTASPAPGPVSTVTDPTWAHIAGAGSGSVGYYFPGAAPVKMQRESRSGSWSDINSTYGDSTLHQDEYLSMWFDHGSAPSDARYAYVLLPDKTVAQTQTYAGNPDAVILENSAQVHAVQEKGLHLIAANFWEDQGATVSVNGAPFLSSSSRASVLLEELGGGDFSIAVSDPTMNHTGTIEIEVFRSGSSIEAPTPGVTVTQLAGSVKISVDVAGRRGASESVIIR